MAQIIAGVLIKQNGEYVVQKRDNIPNIAEPGMLTFWGGAADGDETPKMAAVRELLEETGLKVREEELEYIMNYETHGRSPAFIGKTINVYSYFLEVESAVEINCYEGEKAVRFIKLSDIIESGETPNDLLTKAIERYESSKLANKNA